jgi:rhodanese-related sulfurtransferase
VRAISAPDAWLAYELKVPFLDARRSAAFTEGHILGAWSAPVWEADVDTRLTEFEARANPGPRDPIVIYCDGGGCEDSHLLANKLVALGYRNLLIYTDGFPDWTAQGRPVAKGARP